MVNTIDFDSPVTEGVAIGMVGIALSLYFPLLSPIVTIYFLYQGASWYVSPNSRSDKIGLGLLILGILLLIYSYFAITGYITTRGFETF